MLLHCATSFCWKANASVLVAPLLRNVDKHWPESDRRTPLPTFQELHNVPHFSFGVAVCPTLEARCWKAMT